MILEAITVGAMQANCYVLAEAAGRDAIIIDPGADARKIKEVLDAYRLKPRAVINTHGHYDHIGADNEFGVEVYVHGDDEAMLKSAELNFSAMFAVPFKVTVPVTTVIDQQILTFGGIELRALHIPGHTPGGIALLLRKPKGAMVFTGDTLFHHSIGRSDLSGGSGDELINAIKEKLLVLPDETKVYPGHGPLSTIGEERSHNEFLA